MNEVSSNKEEFDFAALELDPQIVPRMERFQFLLPEEMDPNDRIAPKKIYAFIGYPTTLNKTKIKPPFIHFTPFPYVNPPAPPDSYSAIGKMLEESILIPFNREVIERDHHLQPSPKLEGISGGGVWRLGDLKKIAENNYEDVKLVGLCIKEHPVERLLEGVRIGLVTEALRHQYPQLADFLPQAKNFTLTVKLSTRKP